MVDMMLRTGWLINVLDILVVAYVIYRIVLQLKGTMAFRLFTALVMLFAIHVLSRFIGLKTVSWITDTSLASLLIILVIIFQHDIRRALVISSRGGSGKNQGLEETASMIEEVLTAVMSLAGKNIGALIVFEREMPLGNFMAVGTEIDAKVTSELITSIFLPYSPIHDGAVIIQQGKLTKAGCFLPLTQNPDVSKELGTRHRAAIGLSEIVDAAVVIVSEETGQIAIASSGRIAHNLDAAALRKHLRRLLEPRWLK